MKILDTRKVKEQRKIEAKSENELREFKEWLNSATPLDAEDIKNLGNLWNGHSTYNLDEIKAMADSLRKQTGIA